MFLLGFLKRRIIFVTINPQNNQPRCAVKEIQLKRNPGANDAIIEITTCLTSTFLDSFLKKSTKAKNAHNNQKIAPLAQALNE